MVLIENFSSSTWFTITVCWSVGFAAGEALLMFNLIHLAGVILAQFSPNTFISC